MSKIFDALQKLEKEIPGLGLPEVLGESASAAPPPASRFPEEPQPVAYAPAPDGVRQMPLRVLAGAPVLPFDGTHRPASEQYRILRTKIIQHPSRPRMILVSSATPGDGKTVSAINLAGALALKSDSRVLLVDADFRHSAISKLLGIPASPGFADLLRGACSIDDAIIQTEQFPKLYILSAGDAASSPVELLDSAAWSALAASLRQEFSYIVLDAPPIGAVADYDLLQAACDGVILVVRPDHTRRKTCMTVLEAVNKDKFLGILLNCVEDWFLWKASHGYYYYGK
jgi:capsular exopolysaccharide synthesis family protein